MKRLFVWLALAVPLAAANRVAVSQYDKTITRLPGFDDCLVRGTTPADAALLYFRLHGSQTPDLNGDEKDGLDEIFVTSDTVGWNGRLPNYRLDDDPDRILEAIPLRHVLVICGRLPQRNSDKKHRARRLPGQGGDFSGEPGKA